MRNEGSGRFLSLKAITPGTHNNSSPDRVRVVSDRLLVTVPGALRCAALRLSFSPNNVSLFSATTRWLFSLDHLPTFPVILYLQRIGKCGKCKQLLGTKTKNERWIAQPKRTNPVRAMEGKGTRTEKMRASFSSRRVDAARHVRSV